MLVYSVKETPFGQGVGFLMLIVDTMYLARGQNMIMLAFLKED